MSDLSAKSLVVFCIVQLIYTTLTLIFPLALAFCPKWVFLVWLSLLFGTTTWNGASFYIEVTLHTLIYCYDSTGIGYDSTETAYDSTKTV